MLESDTLRFCVIGPGRLGVTLLVALQQAGFAVPAVAGDPATPLTPDSVPPRLPLADAVAGADVLWLAVPDDVIEPVARDAAAALARRPSGGEAGPLIALHSSGLGSLALLEPLRAAGSRTLSLHPLQTFAGSAQARAGLDGVPMAVTAGGDEERAFGAWLAARLGARPFDLADTDKPLYHLAAAVASNLLVALQSEAAELIAEATGQNAAAGARLLAPLVATTIDNLQTQGPVRALTGPVARGDVGTVRAHLALLDARAPRYAAAYRALSLQALTLAAPRLDNEAVRTLRRLLDDEVRR